MKPSWGPPYESGAARVKRNRRYLAFGVVCCMTGRPPFNRLRLIPPPRSRADPTGRHFYRIVYHPTMLQRCRSATPPPRIRRRLEPEATTIAAAPTVRACNPP